MQPCLQRPDRAVHRRRPFPHNSNPARGEAETPADSPAEVHQLLPTTRSSVRRRLPRPVVDPAALQPVRSTSVFRAAATAPFGTDWPRSPPASGGSVESCPIGGGSCAFEGRLPERRPRLRAGRRACASKRRTPASRSVSPSRETLRAARRDRRPLIPARLPRGSLKAVSRARSASPAVGVQPLLPRRSGNGFMSRREMPDGSDHPAFDGK